MSTTSLGAFGGPIGTRFDSTFDLVDTVTMLSAWGGSGSADLSDSAVRLPRCTTGTVDIFINASLVTVLDATGFTVGATIVFRNAREIDQDLIATIASISGNEITLNGSAGVSVTDEFCLVSSSGRWFGPSGDCGCCGECNAIGFFGDSLIELTDMALGNGALLNDYDRLVGNTPQSWTLPAFVNDSTVIDGSTNVVEVSVPLGSLPTRSPINEYDTLHDASWGGTVAFRDNLYFPTSQATGGLWAYANIDSLPPFRDLEGINPIVEASVWYWCGEDPDLPPGSLPLIPLRRINISAKYSMLDLASYTVPSYVVPTDPGWTDQGGGEYTATVGGVYFLYKLSQQIGRGFYTSIFIELYAYTLTQVAGTVSVDLSDAPPYPDAWGLLLGKVTVS